MDETIARRIDYRVIRPDGNLIWSCFVSSAMPHEPPFLDRDGWFDGGFGILVAPPLLVQRRDGDEWTTIERSKG